MSALVWSEDLRLNQPQMDQTHEEFVALLATAREALDGGDQPAALAAFERLLDHSVSHFGQEDRWMRATGFAAENCHTRQHGTVLTLMREVIRLARDELQWEPLGVLIAELGQWFPQHAQAMDAGLAMHMAQMGYDPVTGEMTGVLPQAEFTHCGSGGCG